jgi:peptidyl-prolyl cis-trans isomerase C
MAASPALLRAPELILPRRALRRLLRDPFFHFLLLGFALYLAASQFDAERRQHRIVITDQQLQRIALLYEKQFGAPPTPTQRAALIDSYIREEIFFREGVALSLDRDDEIVRRRVAQKYQFLRQDVALARAASDADLQRFYAAHSERYTRPARRSFTQVFFSPDLAGPTAAEEAARKSLPQLQRDSSGRLPQSGDQFPGPQHNVLLTQAEIARIFGDSRLAEGIFGAPLAQWMGPFQSGYGWHLIRVTDAQAPVLPAFAEVRERVSTDYRDDARLQENERAYAELKSKYDVSVE